MEMRSGVSRLSQTVCKEATLGRCSWEVGRGSTVLRSFRKNRIPRPQS